MHSPVQSRARTQRGEAMQSPHRVVDCAGVERALGDADERAAHGVVERDDQAMPLLRVHPAEHALDQLRDLLPSGGVHQREEDVLDRKAVLDLAELGFVDRCESVLWIGPSGVGKTHLSIGLGVRACQAEYSVRFVRSYKLLRRLYASLADDTLEEVLDELAKPDVLIIDELGNSPKKHEDDLAGVFFELVARRYRRGALVLTTNLGFDQWPSVLGSSSQVTPTIDRLIEGAHIITFPPDAKSYRADRKKGPGPLPSKKKGPRRRSPPPDAPASPP
jgi:IstB-like ATP binding protein